MLSEENRKKIKDFVNYWVETAKEIDDKGLYYSVEIDGKKNFDFPAIAGYFSKRIQLSYLNLVAEAIGFTKDDIQHCMIDNDKNSPYYKGHFVEFNYNGVILHNILSADEYEELIKVLEDNERRKNNEY